MRRLDFQIFKRSNGALEALVFSVLVLWASDVFAAANMGEIADLWSVQIGTIPMLMTSVCYIMGLMFMGQGLVKLKEHAENPQNVKIANGLGRLLAGGAAVSLPVLTGWAHTSLGFGSGGATVMAINVF